MSDSTNFQIFNRVALFALMELFDNFPKQIELDANTLALNAFPEKDKTSVEEAWDLMSFGVETLSWLESEGFVSVKQRTLGGHFIGVRLTLKGLTLLGYELPNGKSSIAEQAREVFSGAGKQTATEVLKSAFQYVLFSATTAVMEKGGAPL
ncbi:MAG: hypothetical protein DSZ27_00925 [Thiomicrospira sp.]|nr:MAG: hypothetical protein DSZ27_00925 [Thiomicrospira sp.]